MYDDCHDGRATRGGVWQVVEPVEKLDLVAEDSCANVRGRRSEECRTARIDRRYTACRSRPWQLRGSPRPGECGLLDPLKQFPHDGWIVELGRPLRDRKEKRDACSALRPSRGHRREQENRHRNYRQRAEQRAESPSGAATGQAVPGHRLIIESESCDVYPDTGSGVIPEHSRRRACSHACAGFYQRSEPPVLDD